MADKKRILIVGGVAGGASAAARARRLSEDAEIIMFERGEFISFANCGLPYHIGGEIKDRDRLLVQTPEKMHQRFTIDVRTRSEVLRIDTEQKHVTVRDLTENREYTEAYDVLVLSPGAEPVRPPLKGIESQRVFTLRSIPDMDAIEAVIDQQNCSRAVVVGGGYIGLEMAEALRGRGLAVSLVELESQVMGTVDHEMAAPVHQELIMQGVDLNLNVSVKDIDEKGDSLEVNLSDGRSIESDLVILAVGVRPEVTLARQAGLKIGDRGGIEVNEQMQTSDPDIYAVGDAVEVIDFVTETATLIPLAGPANRQGRIAADNIFGRPSKYKKTQGTAICKVFNLAIAVTGLNEKALKRQGVNYEKIYVHPANHAGYYPGASQISLKLLFDPESGKILGAQAVGTKGVDKRIDVIAVALRAEMTVFDLQNLELCYAPPFGSAKDPVNYAGFVAANVITSDMPICHVEDMIDPAENQMVIDVRTETEIHAGTIPGAVNIPLDELRGRLDEIPKEKELLISCQVGLRGYIACRILLAKGYKARNLTGGYKTYCAVVGSAVSSAEYSKEMKDDTGEDDSSQNDDRQQLLENITHIDACGLQCPGPIMRLKEELDKKKLGEAVSISSTDHGFATDIKGWCHSTGNQLLDVTAQDGVYTATICKEVKKEKLSASTDPQKTIVVFSDDFDKAMAAFIIANGAASMGSKVTLFFTFWGLNLLRKQASVPVKKTLIERMFGFMMPRGPEKTTLSKMNMAGIGTRMMKGIMRNKNVYSLSELIEKAKSNGVCLVACTMTMELMGIKSEELIEGVEEGGVAMYLDRAESSNVNLFI